MDPASPGPQVQRCLTAGFTETAIAQNSTGDAQPQKLGRYEIVRELGKGAMGVVYLARDPLIGRSVALKTIRLAEGVDEDEAREFRERFLREAQAAGALNHPNIVMVHDIGQDPVTGFSYIAMEFAEGKNLKEVLSAGEPMTFADAAETVAQVADGLDYAHSKGVVHRDVKPANIILHDGRAKITDFGIAKIASSATNLTSTGQFLGTPNYMAPEQVKGTRVDGRTDIFSLGIVLYESLSRKKPFGGDSLTTISYKIVHEPFQSLHEIDQRIPAGFDQIVAKCLGKDPAVRYQRAKDLAEDLRRVARGESPVIAVSTEVTEGATLLNIPAHADEDATVSIPFPEATATGSRGAQGALPPVAPRKPGLFRKRIPAAIFLGILALLLIGFGATAFSLWRAQVPLPQVDEKKEGSILKQRALRVEAEKALQSGDLENAYYKYRELLTLAPASPAVRQKLAEIEEKRILAMTEKQRRKEADILLAQAKVLFDEKQYEDAIPVFEQVLSLEPENSEAASFVKIAQDFAALKKQTERPQRAVARTTATVEPGQQQTVTPVVASTATLRTNFNSPVNEGYVLIRINGADMVLENLFEERRGIIRRNVPRNVSVSREIPAGDVTIETVVSVPRLKITDRQTLPPVKLRPGTVHTITLSLDPNTRRVSVSFS